jgi:hypothetical protein
MTGKSGSISDEDCLGFCQKRGEEPEKPFTGQFVTRVSPDLHRRINVAATLSSKSLKESGVQQTGVKSKANRVRFRSKSEHPRNGAPPAQIRSPPMGANWGQL